MGLNRMCAVTASPGYWILYRIFEFARIFELARIICVSRIFFFTRIIGFIQRY